MSRALEMKIVLLLVVLGGWWDTAESREVVQAITWQQLAAAGAVSSGEVVGGDDGQPPSLRIVHTEATPRTFHVITLEQPAIDTSRYALEGRVRYEGVSSGSYLEMWNHFDEAAFFTRSLGDGGPMGRLDGSSAWRPFVLPFSNREGDPPPEKLVVNLVLMGPGSVDIGPLQLVELNETDDLFADSGAWWNDRQAGLVGGIVGSALGVLGALIGWLGSTGRARGFALGTLSALSLLGMGALALGGIALTSDQPYGVYYPLLLLGGLGTVLGFSLKRSMSKRYEELELRRMQALDA